MCQTTPTELLIKELLNRLRSEFTGKLLTAELASDNVQLRKALVRYLEGLSD